MKLKQTLVGIAAIVTISGSSLVAAPHAQALTCTVIPQSICDAAGEGNLGTSGTWLLLIWIINILSIGVGIVAVAMIAYAAFLYTTAQADENQTKKAKEMIRNVVIGIVVYGFMYALIQWLVPGGVF